MVVMAVVLLRGAGRRVVRATATGRGGRRLSTVTARAAAAAAATEHVHVGHLLQGAGPGTAVRPRWTGIPRFHHQVAGVHGRLDQRPGTAQRRGRRQGRRESGHRGGSAPAARVPSAHRRRRRRRVGSHRVAAVLDLQRRRLLGRVYGIVDGFGFQPVPFRRHRGRRCRRASGRRRGGSGRRCGARGVPEVSVR